MKRRLVIALGIASLCVLALVLLGWFRAGSPAYQGKSIKFWARELNAPDAHRQAQATAAFQALGSNAVPALAKLLRQHDGLLSRAAWDVAGKLPARWGDWLRRQAGPLDATALRADAARALASLGPQAQAAAPALAQALHDEEMRVRYEAGQALGRIGAAGLPVLTVALQDTNAHVRYCAVSGLAGVGSEGAPVVVPALFRALTDPDSTVGFWASQSLARLGTNAAPFLTNVMAKADPVNQQRAAKALGSVRVRAWVVPPLVRLLHDPAAECRVTAVQTLAGLGLPDRAMTSAYLEALKDPDARVRAGAAQGLGQGRAQAAGIVPALAASLEDESPAVRAAAASALGQFGPRAQSAVTNLTRLLADREEAVRTAARNALNKLK